MALHGATKTWTGGRDMLVFGQPEEDNRLLTLRSEVGFWAEGELWRRQQRWKKLVLR